AHRAAADERADVHRRLPLLDIGQPVPESRPRPAALVKLRGQLGVALERMAKWRLDLAAERGRGPALPEALRRHALCHLRDDAVVEHQWYERVRLDIDEPRRDNMPLRIDDGMGLLRGNRARRSDAGDLVVADREVAVEPCVPGAINNASASDQGV